RQHVRPSRRRPSTPPTRRPRRRFPDVRPRSPFRDGRATGTSVVGGVSPNPHGPKAPATRVVGGTSETRKAGPMCFADHAFAPTPTNGRGGLITRWPSFCATATLSFGPSRTTHG